MEDAFDDAAIARLKLAAEEVAWLTGRGYPIDTVGTLVSAHHALTEPQRAALAKGTCSEPQYRRRAAREVEGEDIAKRPLAIDAIDVIAAVEAAIGGRPVLQTLDGTVRAFGIDRLTYQPGICVDEAIDRILTAARELRPSIVKLYIEESANDLRERLEKRAKGSKTKFEMVVVPNVPKAIRKEHAVVTGDADTLDACPGWHNLVGGVVATIANARIVKLQ